jgi:hypothetical protein
MWIIVALHPWPRNMPYKSTAEPVELPLELSGAQFSGLWILENKSLKQCCGRIVVALFNRNTMEYPSDS